jgi:hypothetical protein
MIDESIREPRDEDAAVAHDDLIVLDRRVIHPRKRRLLFH